MKTRGRRTKRVPIKLITDPVDSAQTAGLRYVLDDKPGITRKRSGKSFRYAAPDGTRIVDQYELRRLNSLAIPPAWKDVWICPSSNGHLQATGRDARGRKQYRYHPRWRQVRDETKFDRMIAFAGVLPEIRKGVRKDLGLQGLPRAKVLATIIRLLETTLIRVGNEEYARENHSFGLTTMRDHHVDISGGKMVFRFRGKGGKRHSIVLNDQRLAKIVKHCQDIPGYELFQYVDNEGKSQSIDSADVNEYLRDIAGQEFTAKDFRTWAGTVLAVMALQEFEEFDSQAQAKKNIMHAIKRAAERLGNTPTICRKCYIHPAVIDSYLDGSMLETMKQRAEEEISRSLPDLAAEEAAVIGILQQRLSRETQRSRKRDRPTVPSFVRQMTGQRARFSGLSSIAEAWQVNDPLCP